MNYELPFEIKQDGSSYNSYWEKSKGQSYVGIGMHFSRRRNFILEEEPSEKQVVGYFVIEFRFTALPAALPPDSI